MHLQFLKVHSLSSTGQRARTIGAKHGVLFKKGLLGLTYLNRALWAQVKAEFSIFAILLGSVAILLLLPDLLMNLTVGPAWLFSELCSRELAAAGVTHLPKL